MKLATEISPGNLITLGVLTIGIIVAFVRAEDRINYQDERLYEVRDKVAVIEDRVHKLEVDQGKVVTKIEGVIDHLVRIEDLIKNR